MFEVTSLKHERLLKNSHISTSIFFGSYGSSKCLKIVVLRFWKLCHWRNNRDESWNSSLSLRCFVTLSKITQSSHSNVAFCHHPMLFLNFSITFPRFSHSIRIIIWYSLLFWLITRIYIVFPNKSFQITIFDSTIHNPHRVCASYRFPTKSQKRVYQVHSLYNISYHIISHRGPKFRYLRI